ncbi:MAG: serine/threonine-protein kinase [Polyangiaceae bacterium]
MGERRTCPTCGENYAPDVIFCPRDGAPLGGRKTELQDDAYLGLELAGQFRLEQLIGIGAMGRVYRAHQSGIGRDVAVKILHRELLTNETLIRRFHQEAKVASRLLHPNVVQVLMTGQLPRMPDSLIGGEAYLVMEHLDGISLRSCLAAAGGALPLPRALHIVLQVCDAVGEAHAQNIVHRDLKPENVMLVRRGDDHDFAKVLDFGVARIDLGEESVATQAGAVFGTARYVSPEGARGDRVGPPGDVYALATMLFQTLSATTPFDGDNPVAILVKHANAEAPDVRSIPRSSYVPEPIARVILKNLAKQPAERCADARVFGRALVDAARQSGLAPEDLALRSTLLGGNQALGLSSLQRTKSLDLSPELAARMRGEHLEGRPSAPSGTQIIDPDEPKPATLLEEPTAPPHGNNHDTRVSPALTQNDEPAPVAAPLSVPGAAPDEAEPRTSAAGSQAAAAEPGDTTGRPSAPGSSSPGPASSPSIPDEIPMSGPRSSPGPTSGPYSAPYSGRGSLPSVEPYEMPEEQPRSLKALVLLLCFVLGAGLSVGIAYKLGVFDSKALSAQAYTEQAQQALLANHLVDPPGNNVRDITDAALQQWPKHAGLLRVRREAAARLVAQAEAQKQSPVEATRLLNLATDLDAENARAKQLLRQISKPPELDAGAPSDAAPSATGASVPVPRGNKQPAPRPAPSASAAPSSAPSATPAPTASSGGRWL